MPLAGAEMNTGPSFVTVSGSSPLNAGYRFGTTRTSQSPPSRAVGLECGRGGVLGSGTERTGPGRIGLDLGDSWREVARSLCPPRHHRDPPPGEWVQTQPAHRSEMPLIAPLNLPPSRGESVDRHVVDTVLGVRDPFPRMNAVRPARGLQRLPSNRARPESTSAPSRVAAARRQPGSRRTAPTPSAGGCRRR